MKDRTWLLFAVCLVAGCGPRNYEPPAAADPSEARRAMAHALDAWKSGAKLTSLQEQTPLIHVADEDWSRGDTLLSYQIQGDGVPFGNRVRFDVALELQNAGGRQEKQALFIVATNPAIAISRSDRGE